MSQRFALLERRWLEAREVGLLGPAPVEDHIEHSLAFAEALDDVSDGSTAPHRIVDLGSGAGVPGLVLATLKPETRVMLLDGSARRAEWLRLTVMALDLPNVEVVCARAEETGRQPAHRGHAHAVVARAFGPPGVTAECAAPLLRVGGLLLVSELPAEPRGGSDVMPEEDGKQMASTDRWVPEGLRELGLGRAQVVVRRGRRFVAMVQESSCPERYPRRVGIPQKRPLFPLAPAAPAAPPSRRTGTPPSGGAGRTS